VERKDVGLTLRIKPQIGEGGTIRMTIFQENSSVVGGTADQQRRPVHRQELDRVHRGGRRRPDHGAGRPDRRTNTPTAKTKVPMLGDVPLVGNLFRSAAQRKKSTNLLVFLRPVVMRDAQAASSACAGPLRGHPRAAAGRAAPQKAC
jgi:general secretion pathway protein D